MKTNTKSKEVPRSALADTVKAAITNIKKEGTEPKKEVKEEKKEEKKEEVQGEPKFKKLFTKELEDDDEPEEEEPKKEEEKNEEDEDNISLPENNLKGNPIKESSRAAFKQLEARRDKWRDQAKQFEAELKKLKEGAAQAADPSKVIESDEYKKVVEERNKYKEQLDSIDFDNSPEFKEKYLAPIENTISRIKELMPDDLDKKEAKRLEDLSDKASSLAGKKGMRKQFFNLVDTIKEEFFDGSIGDLFVKEMISFWDTSEEFVNAAADKEKIRKEMLEKRKTQIEGDPTHIQKAIEDEIQTYEKAYSKRIEFWKHPQNSADFNYDKYRESSTKEAIEILKDFQKTGKVTEPLRRLVTIGMFGAMDAKEREKTAAFIQLQGKKIEELKKELEQITTSLQARNGNKGKYKDKQEEPKERESSSAIYDALRKSKVLT